MPVPILILLSPHQQLIPTYLHFIHYSRTYLFLPRAIDTCTSCDGCGY
jgi:hypothetical protein